MVHSSRHELKDINFEHSSCLFSFFTFKDKVLFNVISLYKYYIFGYARGKYWKDEHEKRCMFKTF